MDGRALAAIGVGVLFAYSGIRGWSVLATIQSVMLGEAPQPTLSSPLVSGSGNSGDDTFVGSPSDIADVAVRYVGHRYKFGGAPGRNAENPWDCSSMVNWVAAVGVGLPIPGYATGYDGTVHGPTTGQWAIWPGLQRVTEQDVRAGDIIVWAGHMGIAIDNTRLVSALNPALGTRVTPIQSASRGPIILRGRYARPARNVE